MDKKTYKIPSKQELEQTSKSKGRKGVLKHFILRHDLDSLVTEYAKKLNWSQARVMEEMILVGVNKFEENHGFRAGKHTEKRSEDLTEQLNNKTELLMEQKKKESAKKANDLAEAYSKKIAHGDDDGWQSQWFG